MKYLHTILFIILVLYNAYSQDTLEVPSEYVSIQSAIYASNNGDIVLVAEGIYTENIKFKGKAITIASHYLVDGDKSHISNTTIKSSNPSGADSGSVVFFINGEDTNSVIIGFTIKGGRTRNGGGIHCENAGAKIVYNNIVENSADGRGNGCGGGIFVGIDDSSSHYLVIEHNLIFENGASGGVGAGNGGGIFIQNMNGKIDGRISNNIIESNVLGGFGGAFGGGILIMDCSFLISNNIVIGNNCYSGESPCYGGGIGLSGSNSVLLNNVIYNNSVGFLGEGGGLFVDGSSQPIIINNIIVNNKAIWGGGGIVLHNSPVIINSIIWGNTAEADSQIYDYTGNLEVYFTDIQGGWSGIGNIDTYPEFVDTTNGDFHLKNSSPCIGSGIDSLEISGVWYYCPLTDLEGNPRPNPIGTIPDMGAFESPLSVSGIEDYLSQVPSAYSLEQNFPNPFNPSTKIRYSIPQSSNVTIKVFDILGNEIETLVNEEKQTGTYEITWYAENLPSGIYFYQLKSGNYVETKKMILIK